jgi:hypothetical protein
LKENIRILVDVSQSIEKINGYSFKFIDGGESYGVIAQEVEQVLPHAVSTNDEGNKSVNYNAIIALLIEDSKEKTKQIQSLQKQVNMLNKRIDREIE